MENKQASAYRKTIEQAGMVLGLERMNALLRHLGNPQEKLSFVHVAGTNGKGSVIAFLSAILTEAGYRTGTYTSPAVFDPMEICQVDHIPIRQEEYDELILEIQDVQPELEAEGFTPPTIFEAETALALLYFVRKHCDIVLLETGLGGRLDATNCIPAPLCTILMPVSIDHRAILGDTLEAIAMEKAGIIKRGSQVVSALQESCVQKVFEQVCEEQHVLYRQIKSEQIVAQKDRTDVQQQRYILKYKNYPPVKVGPAGKWQVYNAAVAIEAMEVLQNLGYAAAWKQIEKGIETALWRGRCTLIGQNPLIVMDGAHNAGASAVLADTLQQDFSDVKWVFVTGMLADKEYEVVAANMAHLADTVYTITPHNKRALRAQQLANVYNMHNVEAEPCESISKAVEKAFARCEEEQNRGILAFGSFTFLHDFEQSVRQQYATRLPMQKLDKIIKHPLFASSMKIIEQQEKTRRFCHHGWQHCMDVARGMALLNEERHLGFAKEYLYAVALVHDLGRAQQYMQDEDHHDVGRTMAGQILADCGFSTDEAARAAAAVGAHGSIVYEEDVLAQLLVEADKKTRLCFLCEAAKECYWTEERKNQGIDL